MLFMPDIFPETLLFCTIASGFFLSSKEYYTDTKLTLTCSVKLSFDKDLQNCKKRLNIFFLLLKFLESKKRTWAVHDINSSTHKFTKFKAVTYNEKKTTFTQASLFIFGPSSYVMVLQNFNQSQNCSDLTSAFY